MYNFILGGFSMRWKRHNRTFHIYVDELSDFFLRVNLPKGITISAAPSSPNGFEIIVKARTEDANTIEHQLILATDFK